MDVSFVFLRHLDLVLDHTCMIQATRKPRNAGLLYSCINVVVLLQVDGQPLCYHAEKRFLPLRKEGKLAGIDLYLSHPSPWELAPLQPFATPYVLFLSATLSSLDSKDSVEHLVHSCKAFTILNLAQGLLLILRRTVLSTSFHFGGPASRLNSGG